MIFDPADQNISDQVNRDLAEQHAQAKAIQWDFPYVHLGEYPVNLDMLRLFSKSQAQSSRLFAFDRKIKTIRLATYEPHQNEVANQIIQALKTQNYEVEFYVCSPESFTEALRKYDSELLHRKKMEIKQSFDEKDPPLSAIKQKFQALMVDLKEQLIPGVLAEIQLLALEARASDIHLQPNLQGALMVRIRVDGVLHDMLEIPRFLAPKFVTKAKYDAGMKSNITDQPQDGRIRLVANNRPIELRVSTLPMEHCESVVMRVLDSYKAIRSFSELGFSPRLQQKMTQVLERKNGIVLVTGPTGSGKTTTLYSMLKELNSSEQKLVTLEDPVEYHLAGVTQSEVNESSNYTFDNGFRALLRHDPDVILVGEIRTQSTAHLAFEAALTGHTVLSSLHTNHAVGAVTRLRNMGLEDHKIAPTINAVFAQRLVRRLRPTAQVKRANLEQVIAKNINLGQSVARFKFLFPNESVPTDIIVDTNNSSEDFAHREAVAEVILFDDGFKTQILSGASEIVLRKYLFEQTDYAPMMVNALRLLFEGKTTLKELQRVMGS